jgi:hypothetical protein
MAAPIVPISENNRDVGAGRHRDRAEHKERQRAFSKHPRTNEHQNRYNDHSEGPFHRTPLGS